MSELSGLTELQEKISKKFKRFAVPGRLERTNQWNIQWKIKENPEITLLFRFVTEDGLDIATELVISKLSREYLDNMVREVIGKMTKYREQRQKEQRSIILPK